MARLKAVTDLSEEETLAIKVNTPKPFDANEPSFQRLLDLAKENSKEIKKVYTLNIKMKFFLFLLPISACIMYFFIRYNLLENFYTRSNFILLSAVIAIPIFYQFNLITHRFTIMRLEKSCHSILSRLIEVKEFYKLDINNSILVNETIFDLETSIDMAKSISKLGIGLKPFTTTKSSHYYHSS